MAIERLKKLNLDFSEEAVFESFIDELVRALELISNTKHDFSIDNRYSDEHVHRAIHVLKENNLPALECIKIKCKRKIFVAPPAFIAKMSGKSGRELAEMSFDEFVDYMKNLK